MNSKFVYRTALLGAEKAEGLKDTVELYVDGVDSRNETGRP